MNCKQLDVKSPLYKSIQKMVLYYDGTTTSFSEHANDIKLALNAKLTNESINDEEFNRILNAIVGEQQKINSGGIFSTVVMSTIEKELDELNKKNTSSVSKYFTIKDNVLELFPLTQSSYDYMKSSFTIDMLKATFVNKEKGKIVSNDEEVNSFMLEYKNKLFNVLKDYVGNTDSRNLYNDDYTVNSDLYNEVFTKIDEDSKLKSTNLNIDPNNKRNQQDSLNPYNAAVILNNFDHLVGKLFGGVVNVNPVLNGYLENVASSPKYTLTGNTVSTMFWKEDNDHNKDATMFTSNLMVLIANTIPMVDSNGKIIEGQYLGRNNLYNIAQLIKKAEAENLLKGSKSAFLDKPVAMLKYYLESTEFTELNNNKNIIRSLHNYLYNDSDIESYDRYVRNVSLNTIQNNFNGAKNNSLRSGNLTNNVNLIGLFAFELSKNVAPQYNSYNENGLKPIELTAYDKSSGFVKNTIKENIDNQAGEVDNIYTQKAVAINGSYVNLNDLNIDHVTTPEFIEYFKTLTGFELNETIKGLIENNKSGSYITIIKAVVNKVNDVAKRIYAEDDVKKHSDILDSITSGEYIAFSHAIVDNENRTILMNIEDSKGNSIPIYRLNSAIFNDAHFIKSYHGADNLFKTNPGLLTSQNNRAYKTSTSLRLDANVTTVDDKGNERTLTKKAAEFTPEESMYASFFGDYMSSVKNSGIFATQIAAYSDKGSIFLKNVNLHAKVGEKSLSEMSNGEILNLHYTYQNKYFTRIINKVIGDWSVIMNTQLLRSNPAQIQESVKKINTFLTKSNQNSLHERLLELDSEGKHIEIVNELHFSKYKTLEFNRNLLYNYDNVSTPENFRNWHKKNQLNFLDKLQESNHRNLFSPKNFLVGEKSVNDVISKILKNTDKTKSDDFIKVKELYTEDGSKIRSEQVYLFKQNGELGNLDTFDINSNIEVNPLVDRYLILSNLIKDQYMGITVKHPYIHAVKGAANMTLEEEDSARVKAASKRMVILPATLENYMQDLLDGVPSMYKTAVVSDPSLSVFNFVGSQKSVDGDGKLGEKGQDVWDGVMLISPFMSILEEFSLPAKGIKGTKKPIGFYAGDGYSVLQKCAQNVISNFMIRNSTDADISLENLMEKMHGEQWKHKKGTYKNIDLTKNYLGGDFKIPHASPEGVFYRVGNKYFRVVSLERESFDEITGTSYTVNLYEVNANGKKIQTISNPNVKINSLHELWKVMGAQYSVDLSHGSFDWSENSSKVVAQYMNNIGHLNEGNPKEYNQNTVSQPLKHHLISVVSTMSSTKNGAANVNPTNILNKGNNTPLTYFKIGTADIGIQLDANHEADYSEITQLSQVISTLAANGHTINEANEAYDEIAKLIKESIESVNVNLAKPDLLYADMAKVLVDVFKTADKISLGQSIIENVLADALNKKIPFSDPNFFGLFTSTIISRLNNSTIKNKYTGIGGVLNASAKMLQVYQDKDGNKYLWTDLLDKASKDESLSNILDNKELVNAYLEKYMPNEDIDVTNVRLGDTILIDGVAETILSPRQLQDLNDYASIDTKIQKVFSKPRDLKPMDLSWEQEGISKNIWLTDAVRFATNIQENPSNNLMLKSYLNYMTGDDSLYMRFSKGEKGLTVKVEKLAKKWVQRTFEALHHNSNYKSIKESAILDDQNNIIGYDFNQYFQGDKLRGPLENRATDNFIPISNIKQTEAEAILPKVHSTIFGLGNDTISKIKEQGFEYFKNKLATDYYAPVNGLDLLYRTSDGNIGVRVGEFENYDIKGISGKKVIVKTTTEGNDTYRIDDSGKKMYLLPNDAEVYKYIIDGVAIEVVYIKDTKQLTSFSNSLKKKTSSIGILANNIETPEQMTDILNIGKFFNSTREYKSLYKNLSVDVSNVSKTKNDLVAEFGKIDKYLDSISKGIYSSWLKSQEVLSARIPSQAFQSFMGMENVAYSEGTSNDIYVSHWQLWLQGSDLDIDKAYTMMYSINENGLFEGWSDIFDYSSKESLDLSEKLPTPNGKKYELEVSPVEIPNKFDVTPYVTAYNTKKSLDIIVDLIEKLNSLPKGIEIYSNIEDFGRLIRRVNEHNATKTDKNSSKNKIVSNIRKVSNDLRNAVSSYSPIDIDEHQAEVKKVDMGAKLMTLYDGNMSVFQIQNTNYVGKSTVGVMANGNKSFFTITSYLNNYYKTAGDDIKVTDNPFFIKSFVFDGKKYSVSGTIGDTLVNENQSEILKMYLQSIEGKELEIPYVNNDDVSLLHSAYVTLATDNAKELALAKLNAGLEMAGMHVYLTTLGFTPDIVAKYMTGNFINNRIKKALVNNVFTGEQTTIENVIEGIKREAKFHKVELSQEEKQFIDIYEAAQELRSLTSKLKINQGITADMYTAASFFESIKNEFYKAEASVYNPDKAVMIANIQKKQLHLNKSLSVSEYDIYSYINNILDKAWNYNLISNNLDINKYFSDENYRQTVVDYYGLFKNTFNQFDVLNSSPHFYNMISALNLEMNRMKILSSKFKFVTEEAPKLINSVVNKVNTESTKLNFNATGKNLVYSKDNIHSVVNFYDDYIVNDWLSSDVLRDFSFNIADLSKVLKGKEIKYYDKNGNVEFTPMLSTSGNKILNFNDLDDTASFKYIMETYMIPELLKKGVETKGNDFVKSLQLAETKAGLKYYKLSIDMRDLTNPTQNGLYYSLLGGFNQISELETGLKNINGKDLKWGDLLFIYNAVVNKNKHGSNRMTKIFEKYITQTDKIGMSLSNLYAEYDNGKSLNVDPMDVLFSVYNKKGKLFIKGTEEQAKLGITGVIMDRTNKNYTFPLRIIPSMVNTNAEVTKILQYLKNNGFILNLNCE